MKTLLAITKKIIADNTHFPFSVYTSFHEQCLLSVPITKPLLIVVLKGKKKLGKNNQIECNSGQFIFLSDKSGINIRNIPENNEYFALLIDFNYEDFENIPNLDKNNLGYIVGNVDISFEKCLQQFIECSLWASEAIFSSRKKEILLLLYQIGYTEVASMMTKPQLSYQLHQLLHEKKFKNVDIASICGHLAISESTLRRKLKSEGTSIQEVKDRAKLGFGLHLLQTTPEPIGLIAEKCGYYSQSRFSERFKGLFGITPSELRKTKLAD
jgi:AraC-like DNA-binding protein